MNFPRDQQAQIDFQPKSWLLVYYLLQSMFDQKQSQILGDAQDGLPYVEDAPGVFSVFDQYQEEYIFPMPEEV